MRLLVVTRAAINHEGRVKNKKKGKNRKSEKKNENNGKHSKTVHTNGYEGSFPYS